MDDRIGLSQQQPGTVADSQWRRDELIDERKAGRGIPAAGTNGQALSMKELRYTIW